MDDVCDEGHLLARKPGTEELLLGQFGQTCPHHPKRYPKYTLIWGVIARRGRRRVVSIQPPKKKSTHFGWSTNIVVGRPIVVHLRVRWAKKVFFYKEKRGRFFLFFFYLTFLFLIYKNVWQFFKADCTRLMPSQQLDQARKIKCFIILHLAVHQNRQI